MIIIAIFTYVFLPDVLEVMNSPNSKFIGVITKADGDIRIRYGESINWRSAKKNDQIYAHTYIFTGNNSEASYGLLDESSVTIGPNSMIFLDAINSQVIDGRGLSLELIEGKMQLNLKDGSEVKRVQTDDSVIDLKQNQKLLVQLNYEKDDGLQVSVYDGDIKIRRNNQEQSVKSGETTSLSDPTSPPAVEKIDPIELEKIKKDEEKKQIENIANLKRKRQVSYLINSLLTFFK